MIKSIYDFHLYTGLALGLAFCVSACTLYEAENRPSAEYLARAERSTSAGDYETAIKAYEKHMHLRRLSATRAEWENPSFYFLLIGDLYLRMDRDENAREAYLSALTDGVEERLVIDRLRGLADWYAQKKRYDEALEVLETHRALDPILMNVSLDRIARESLAAGNNP